MYVDTPKVSQNSDTISTQNNCPLKSCCWGDCTSSSDNLEPGLIWVPFPQPGSSPGRARQWAELSGIAVGFGYLKITKDTYICSLHFEHGALLDYT